MVLPAPLDPIRKDSSPGFAVPDTLSKMVFLSLTVVLRQQKGDLHFSTLRMTSIVVVIVSHSRDICPKSLTTEDFRLRLPLRLVTGT